MTVEVWHDEGQRFAATGRLDEGPCCCPDCIAGRAVTSERTPEQNAEIAHRVEVAAADFLSVASDAYWRAKKTGEDRLARGPARAQANAYYEVARQLSQILGNEFIGLPREQTGHSE